MWRKYWKSSRKTREQIVTRIPHNLRLFITKILALCLLKQCSLSVRGYCQRCIPANWRPILSPWDRLPSNRRPPSGNWRSVQCTPWPHSSVQPVSRGHSRRTRARRTGRSCYLARDSGRRFPPCHSPWKRSCRWSALKECNLWKVYEYGFIGWIFSCSFSQMLHFK